MGREFEIKSVEYNENTGVVDVYAVVTTGIESVTTEITITKNQDKDGEKETERQIHRNL